MIVEGLIIPQLLSALINTGIWPSHREALQEQNNDSLIPPDRNRKLRRICLYPLPFKTLASAGKEPNDFYKQFGAIHELVPEAAIPIADFGIGADSPILLNFRQGPSNPSVIYLKWPGQGIANFWEELAPDFETFAEMLGLRPPIDT